MYVLKQVKMIASNLLIFTSELLYIKISKFFWNYIGNNIL